MVNIDKRKLVNGKISLLLDIHWNGERSREFLKLYLTGNRAQDKETMLLAEARRAKRQLELQSSHLGITPAFKKKYNFVEYFYNSMPEKDRLNKKNYHSGYKHLKDYTSGIVQISAIDEHWIENFLKYLLERISTNSALKYLDYIKAILHQAVRERIISTNPFVYFKNKVRLTEVKIEYLEINEIQTLFNTKCNQENIKDAFLFSCYTGLRLSDTRNLTWGNIEAEQIKFTQKKTKSQEYLPLSPTVVKILKNYKPKDKNNSSSPIFNLPSQQVVSVNLKKWGKDAGIKKPITFHIARHTFATMSLTTGTEVYTVSKLMGHRDLRQTQRYAKVIDATKVKAVNNLPRLKINKRQKLTQNI